MELQRGREYNKEHEITKSSAGTVAKSVMHLASVGLRPFLIANADFSFIPGLRNRAEKWHTVSERTTAFSVHVFATGRVELSVKKVIGKERDQNE